MYSFLVVVGVRCGTLCVNWWFFPDSCGFLGVYCCLMWCIKNRQSRGFTGVGAILVKNWGLNEIDIGDK